MTYETVTSAQHYFDTLDKRFQAQNSKGMNATFQFELAGEGGGTWHVVVSDGTMTINQGASATPTATIKMKAEDYVQMVNGKINGTMAFMKGQMKVTGNMLLAQKMQSIFPQSK